MAPGTMKYGRCLNTRPYDGGKTCSVAAARKIISASDRNFVCPECGARLVPAPKGGLPVLPIAAGVVGLLILVGGGYGAWTMFGGPEVVDYCAMSPEERRETLDRQMKTEALDPAAARQAAAGLRDDCGDVAFALILLRAAADQGDLQSALEIAQLYDPARPSDVPVRNSLVDARAAQTWYRRALAGQGTAGPAGEGLRDLKTWAERRAAEGDQAARDLVSRWQETPIRNGSSGG